MGDKLQSLALAADLLPGELMAHRMRNYNYLMELKTDNLLMPYRVEAGLFRSNHKLTDCHWGWDGPLSDLRGQFTGHWLSAASRMIQTTGDVPLTQKANFIVAEIARCQQENGGEWGFSIPEKHLLWLKRGKHTWAPQYVCHKCMMGLLDMYRFAGNEQALEIVKKEADWFYRYTEDISRELMSDMMDWEETGGLMEYWADLYAVTGDPRHLELMGRYERPRLFDPLLEGVDVLTNMHANTTIPEVHGAARAYEVTGEEHYRKIVEAYWDMAVTKRGMYATGGQTCGEIWTPMGQQVARLGDKNQEHCVVYNMMRLAEYLLRWTGDAAYADYIERNLYNGILAQGHWREDKDPNIYCDCPHCQEGLIAYYLPMAPGSKKHWGTKTETFWCCHDTLVQANATLQEGMFYLDDKGLLLCQYESAICKGTFRETPFTLTQHRDKWQTPGLAWGPVQKDVPARPMEVAMEYEIAFEAPVQMTLRIRKPWWQKGEAEILRNGAPVEYIVDDKGFFAIEGLWEKDVVTLCLKKALTCWPLPDAPDTVAFMDGPVVLAGICDKEYTLFGDKENPTSMMAPACERQWQNWLPNWKTTNQPVNIAFRPLYKIGNETYTVYFPIVNASPFK